MALVITIAGADKTNQIDFESLEVQQNLTKTSDQMIFNIKNYGTKTYVPNLNDEVVFTNGSTKVFGGYVVSINDVIEGLAMTKEIVVKDYSFALDNVLIAETYENMTANAIIADLMTNAPSGFTYANVNATPIITKIVFRYISLTECFKKLASYLTGYDWYVDYDKDIHFLPIGSVLSPFNLTDTSQNYVFGSLNVVDDISQMANYVYIQGGKVAGTATKTEYFSGDATRTQFALGNDFYSTPTVTVGGVSKTVGIDGQDADASFDCMWNQNSQLIRFTAGNTPASATNNIVVVGTPRFPLIYIKSNESSIATYGAKPKLITDRTIIDLDTASRRADAELASFSLPVGSAEFITHTAGLVIGQYINIASTIRGISQNYKIQSIRTRLRTPTALQYEIKCQIAGSTDINDILTQLLITNQEGQSDPTINDSIQRIRQFSESITITESVTVTTSSPPYVWDTAVWNLFTWS